MGFGHFKIAGPDGASSWMSGQAVSLMLGLTVLTMAIIYLLPKLSTAIPSSLAAVLIVSGLVAGLGIETKTVGDVERPASPCAHHHGRD